MTGTNDVYRALPPSGTPLEQCLKEFNPFWDRESPGVHRYINSRCPVLLFPRHLVDDAHHETFMRARNAYINDSHKPERRIDLSPKWLRAIARNYMRSYNRKRRPRSFSDISSQNQLFENMQPFGREHDEHTVTMFFTQGQSSLQYRRRNTNQIDELLMFYDWLEPDDKEIIAMKYFEKMSTATIARELKIEISAARQRIFRATKRLEELCEKHSEFWR
jgi:RNA polymerase sigma factor (sigma-70 family)